MTVLAGLERQWHRVRGEAVSAVAWFLAAQGAIALSALVRVPMIVNAVGRSGYGLVATTASTIAVLIVPAAALRSSSRVSFVDAGSGREQGVRHAFRSTLTLLWLPHLLVAIALAIVTMHGALVSLPSAAGWAVLASTVAPVALTPFAIDWGSLEARGLTHLPYLHISVWAVLGLVATGIGARSAWSLGYFVVISSASSVAHLLTLHVVVARSRRRFRGAGPSGGLPTSRRRFRGPGPSGGMPSVRPTLLTAAMFSRALQEAIQRGFDVVVAGVVFGPAVAGEYFLIQRVAQLATFVSSALQPVLSRRFVAEVAVTRAALLRRTRIVTALSLVALALFVAVAPHLVRLLAQDTTITLVTYLATAVFQLVFVVDLVVSSAFGRTRYQREYLQISTVSVVVGLLGIVGASAVGIWALPLGCAASSAVSLMLWARLWKKGAMAQGVSTAASDGAGKTAT